ncbi:peptidoglycan bridge formation protein FemAB [Tsuneonella deserti]|uniref:Peptidoglycan bridge formation protein FemAB n=1 Tax=Tsuneonella deserti TaxID=2035528 RepID=A0ABQ1S7B2_9SPHN|nr:FemAB family XrtA/PEP-CTERM system-associated protein [Tsuneonella deserti]GGD93345.1 peptidoglycan bridge formation protein FemAB [Tsuneonella deserti]
MNAPFASSSLVVRIADLRDRWEASRVEGFLDDRCATPFHRPAWLLAIEQGTGQRACGLVAERHGVITGWLPLVEARSPFFPAALVSSGFGVAGGPLAETNCEATRLLEAATELAVRLSCASVEIRGGHIPADWARQTGKHANFLAPLSSDDAAQLSSIPRKQRAEVRKGLEQAFTVRTGNGNCDRAAHFSVYAESVRNLGTPVFPRSLFDAVLDHFGKDADTLTLCLQDKPIASVLTLYHRGVAMPYWGGGTFTARATRANERLYFELMRHARERGCHTFDFGRSKVGSGAYAYKKNWGFEPTPLNYAVWSAPGSAARDVDPTSESYSGKIAMWKRLPLAVANRLGPRIARGLA